MKLPGHHILAINGGSSGIKFALFETGESLKSLFHGELAGIGRSDAAISFANDITGEKNGINIIVPDYDAAADFLVNWLEKQDGFDSVKAIGHRIVYGKGHTEPAEITADLLTQLSDISIYDTEHLPGEIKLAEIFSRRYPAVRQMACFDTSFHAAMPRVAKMVPIPRRYYAMGIQRYGFHGLSYAYLMEELKRIAGDKAAMGNVILAHLGNGASIAAVKEGKSIDTSMGFSPASGIPMSTRSGDIDPGIVLYLMKTENPGPDRFNDLFNHKSGLLGVSETSSDMRDLLKSESADYRAAEAVALFCYQTRKWIGSFAAVLEGLDTLVFAGGIGENAAEIRTRVCAGFQFLGIELDEGRNSKHEAIISADISKVCVRVIKTNEELMIAKLVCNATSYAV